MNRLAPLWKTIFRMNVGLDMAEFDATMKELVEHSPEDWLAFAGLTPAPARLIDADIATISGAAIRPN